MQPQITEKITEDYLAPVRGIVWGLIGVIPFWIVVGIAVGFVLAR